ncbi:hypothetical protein [Rhodohalobacter sp.]|uniref:hypothetical protein n=1 Tax=Rhodohalobacter sp. TaxID=1974210 RepID=UPI0035672B02
MNKERNLIHSIVYPAVATGLILLIPFIAMQFSNEVVWTLSDFAIAGTLLFGTGLTYTLVTRKSGKIAYRLAVGFALFTGLLLIWVNMAVGIIGSENNDINLLYFLVIFTGIVGGFISQFQPKGLMITLFAMAIVQALIAVTALLTGMGNTPGSSVYEIIAVNGFFITLFIVAASLFRYADLDRKIS